MTAPAADTSHPTRLNPRNAASEAGRRNTPDPIMLPMTIDTAAQQPMTRGGAAPPAMVVMRTRRLAGGAWVAARMPHHGRNRGADAKWANLILAKSRSRAQGRGMLTSGGVAYVEFPERFGRPTRF